MTSTPGTLTGPKDPSQGLDTVSQNPDGTVGLIEGAAAVAGPAVVAAVSNNELVGNPVKAELLGDMKSILAESTSAQEKTDRLQARFYEEIASLSMGKTSDRPVNQSAEEEARAKSLKDRAIEKAVEFVEGKPEGWKPDPSNRDEVIAFLLAAEGTRDFHADIVGLKKEIETVSGDLEEAEEALEEGGAEEIVNEYRKALMANWDDIVELLVLQGEGSQGEGNAFQDFLNRPDNCPGISDEMLEGFLGAVTPALKDLSLRAREAGLTEDEIPGEIEGYSFDPDKFMDMAKRIAADLGFNGRIAYGPGTGAMHINPNEVVIFLNPDTAERNPIALLEHLAHETGHELLDRSTSIENHGTPLGAKPHILHETVARFYQGMGRSEAYAGVISKQFKEVLGVEISPEEVFEKMNIIPAEPDEVRVLSDSVRYPLHVIARVITERRLLGREIQPEDSLVDLRANYKELLGIDAELDEPVGDSRWLEEGEEGFGYFPSYLIADFAAATLRKIIPDYEVMLERGDIAGITKWMQNNIFKLANEVDENGFPLSLMQIVETLSGRPLGPEDFLAECEESVKRQEQLREKLDANKKG